MRNTTDARKCSNAQDARGKFVNAVAQCGYDCVKRKEDRHAETPPP